MQARCLRSMKSHAPKSPSPDGEDEDADPACPGVFEGASTFGGSGSGGEDIIDEKDAFSNDVGWALKCADQVL